MVSQAFLALGSNLGQRQVNLQSAVNALGELMAIGALSPLYETEPWGITNQPRFINACIRVETTLSPEELLAALKATEKKLGRKPGTHWGPRLIDIDLLFYDDLVIDASRLSVPHPQLSERAFVLAPLADIGPNFVDPRSGLTVNEMLKRIGDETVELLDGPDARLMRPSQFAWGVKTYVMGIVNSTPDSFSGDGLQKNNNWVEIAVEMASQMASAGADILDIGGESTRPGSSPISQQEELERVIPVIEAVRQSVDLPISIDTYRASVAKAALSAGATWVNDVWGMRMDPDMVALVANSSCPVILMHNRSKPKNVEQADRLGGHYVGITYDDLIKDVIQELRQSINLALQHGVNASQIIVDPGIGFGKTIKQNLQLIDNLDQIKELGFPILVGTSRKSFIGYTLSLPPDQRLEGTAATISIAIDRGADMVRVHDVEAMNRVARMTDQIVRR